MAKFSTYYPSEARAHRERARGLSEYQKFRKPKSGATQKGNLHEAKDVLKQATLRIKEYENFRESLSSEELLPAKYGVEAIGEHTILFVIPKATTRLSILEEALTRIKEKERRDLIDSEYLSERQNESRFMQEQETSKRLCIDGHLQGGDAKTTAQ